MTGENTICGAIRDRRLVSFQYEGLPRIVIPCALGQHKSTGNLLLRAYQVQGATESGSLPLWRLYVFSGVSGLMILDEAFDEVPVGYKRGDRAFRSILCQL